MERDELDLLVARICIRNAKNGLSPPSRLREAARPWHGIENRGRQLKLPVEPPLGGSTDRLLIGYDRLPFHPTPTAPVSAALVFAPDVTLVPSPTPIIWMNDDARFARVFVPSLYMPTNVAVTGNRCRTAHSRQRQHASAECHAQCDLSR
jgi:hypothetical protein